MLLLGALVSVGEVQVLTLRAGRKYRKEAGFGIS